jgi:hypothetical protein
MLFLPLVVPFAFAALATASTPDGFEPAVQTQLAAVFPGNISVSPSGILLQKAGHSIAFRF